MNKSTGPKKPLHTARTNRKGLELIALFTTAAFVVGGVTAGASGSYAAATNDSPPTADELMNRPWFVKQNGDWFKYARHNWYEQRREAEYQFSMTIEHPAETVTVSHEEYQYQIDVPYWTVEHKEVNDHGNPSVIRWLEEIGATKVGNGWWAIPDSVVASVNFNPLSVADTGTVNLSFYRGPSVTVDYRKTEEIAWDDSAEFDIEQTKVMYWNGSSWGPNPTWVRQSTPPRGADLANVKKRTVSEGEKEVKPGWTETLYATADGGTTHNKAEAGWLTKAPEGDGWTQIGEARYPEWNDDDPWVQVVGYDWTKGKDPGPQPDYYDGYNAETQRFRPVIKKWKVRLEAPPGTETPPDAETPANTATPPKSEPLDPQPIEQQEVPNLEPSRLPPKKKPVQAEQVASQPIERQEVPNLEPSRLPPKRTPVQAEPAHKPPVPVKIDAGM